MVYNTVGLCQHTKIFGVIQRCQNIALHTIAQYIDSTKMTSSIVICKYLSFIQDEIKVFAHKHTKYANLTIRKTSGVSNA